MTRTLEDVFTQRLVTDPTHILERVRDFLEVHPTGECFTRECIDKHLVPWLSLSEDNTELARKVLGPELMALLRPI